MLIRTLLLTLLIGACAKAVAQPRDRSTFTHLNEEGYPLNVNPEIVAAADAAIGGTDMVMAWSSAMKPVLIRSTT